MIVEMLRKEREHISPDLYHTMAVMFLTKKGVGCLDAGRIFSELEEEVQIEINNGLKPVHPNKIHNPSALAYDKLMNMYLSQPYN